ncbi:uncharacterized protein BP5553_05090 [Venustampulla echinocandica]|uniref:Uncharacterized protein n=1 Tax=Venustampulla echinocandica TaxID=2656787 RepID=A0A370TQ49_9HELO|nr:uncharacterized protein BP5553_05090 [Venustampulla echinocandica]RDL37657.1 hypothetical protein BP5553_05090 [Venustampulla echinocandica]
MGTSSPFARSLKRNFLKFLTYCSRSERSPTRTVAQIFPEESSDSISFVHPINKISELASGDTVAMSPPCPTEVVSGNPVITKVAVANVTLRSISPYASEKEVQDMYEILIDNFRYEECYKVLCGPSKPPEPNANFRDLLLGQIGHINRRNQSHGSMVLDVDLEKYVDDPRRHQNENFSNFPLAGRRRTVDVKLYR